MRVSQRRRRWLFDLPTATVSYFFAISLFLRAVAHIFADANQFKEAFIKAQQENEALFKGDTAAPPA